MALRLSTDLKNYLINQGIIKQMAGAIGTGGTCVLKIYNGTQPTSADDGTNGTLLCTIINLGWGGSNGTIGSTQGLAQFGTAAGYTRTAATTGTASWASMKAFGTNAHGSAGTFRIDGDVGTSASAAFQINSTTITALGSVTILSMPISV